MAALPFEVHSDDLLVNVRRGVDYGALGWTLPLSYYLGLLRDLPLPGRVYVCGTCIDDRMRAAFRRYSPIYCDDLAPMEQFVLMTRFNRIILSNSTFAWWAAFLSDAVELYAPRAAGGAMDRAFAFTGFREVDLHMREARYREVPVARFTRKT